MFSSNWLLRVFLILTLLGVGGIFDAQAQDGSSTCTEENAQAWCDFSFDLIIRYERAFEQPSLENLAEIQALRRELDRALVPDCSGFDADFDNLRLLFDLSSDWIVAAELNNTALTEELLPQIENLKANAEQAIAACGRQNNPEITSHEDGQTIDSFLVNIAGEYDPDALTNADLWVMVVTPGQRWFPQSFEGCDPESRQSVSYVPFDKTWAISVFLGSETEGIGDTFQIRLFEGDATATEFIWAKLDEWCAAGSFPGLTAQDLVDYNFTQHDRVDLTRTQ